MNEELRALRYKTKPTIWVPNNAGYVDGLLQWFVEYDAGGRRDFEEVSVLGCLKDFVELAEATEEQVLAFTRRRGVLGVMPSFNLWSEATSISHHSSGMGRRVSCQVIYEESPRIYVRMALVLRHLLATMDYVRTGRKVNAREAELFRRVTRYSPRQIEYKSRAEAHRSVLRAARTWQKAASLSLGLWPFENDEDVTCDFWLDFGTWEQGYEWDYCSGDNSENDSQRTLFDHFDEPPYVHNEMQHIYCSSTQNKWLDAIPFPSGRPSPLFNVLVLQLLEEIALPKDNYFCTRCGTMYPYNEKTKKAGASKPRSDRPTSFCSDECRIAYNGEKDSIRHKRKRLATS